MPVGRLPGTAPACGPAGRTMLVVLMPVIGGAARAMPPVGVAILVQPSLEGGSNFDVLAHRVEWALDAASEIIGRTRRHGAPSVVYGPPDMLAHYACHAIELSSRSGLRFGHNE